MDLRGGILSSGARARPESPLIWVKYGRTLREAGELAQAEAAFRNAIATDWAAADSHLQLGHVLNMQGKKEDAEASFLRAFALDPSLEAASLELTQLGCPAAHCQICVRSLTQMSSPSGTMTGTPKGRFSAGPSKRVHRVNHRWPHHQHDAGQRISPRSR